MDEGQFDFLVGKRTVKIIKEDTVMRPCIKPHEIVCVALCYLASGEVDINVCSTVIELLGPDLLNTPRSKEKWLEISNKFEERWNFPNGLGAVDGKHIVMEQLSNSGSHYRNYKGTDSIILLAMIGLEYEFL